MTAPDGWWQIDLAFPDETSLARALNENVAAVLDPTGRRWWFMRKPPGLRVRIEADPTDEGSQPLIERFAPALATGRVLDVRATIYEAETAAFGGTSAMNLAHDLFHHDAQHISRLAMNRPPLGDRETSVLLISTMLRAAGLEGYERGDVWARVTHDRPLTGQVQATQIARLASDLEPMLHASTTPDGGLTGESGPLAALSSWFDAFHSLGTGLATLNRAGELQRGLRTVLAYHVIFHWNRLGIPSRHQSALAHGAREAVLGP